MASREWYLGPVRVPIRAKREESPEQDREDLSSEEEEQKEQVEERDPFSGEFGCMVLLEREGSESAIGIIESAAAKSKIPLEAVVKPEPDDSFACELYLNNLLLASGSGPTEKWARHVAFDDALIELRRQYFTLKYRPSEIETEDDLPIWKKILRAELAENNVGYRLMRQMGWLPGRSLGPHQLSLREVPLYLNAIVRPARQGLGYGNNDLAHWMKALDDYADSPSISDVTVTVNDKIEQKELKKKINELQLRGDFKKGKVKKNTVKLRLSKCNKAFEVAQLILDFAAVDPENNYELIPPSDKGVN